MHQKAIHFPRSRHELETPSMKYLVSLVLLNFVTSTVTLHHYLSTWDKRKIRKQEHEKLPSTKRKRAATKKHKLSVQLTAEIESRRQHEDYGSGMAVLNPTTLAAPSTTRSSKKRKAQTQGQRRCGACGEVGHRRDSTMCARNLARRKPVCDSLRR
jgi:hypothetical protein